MANLIFPPRFRTFPTWQNEVEAVLLEVEPRNLPQRLEVAKAAVTLRSKNLVDNPDGQLERVAIADAKKLIMLVQEVNAILEAKQQALNTRTVRAWPPGYQGALGALSGVSHSQGYLRSITSENLQRKQTLERVAAEKKITKNSAA
jgi:hypothetical protein